MANEHPGLAYISRHGEPASEADILRYTDFLRQAAGLGHGPIISLQAIYDRFGMPQPARARLRTGRGFVLNPDTGHIVIAEDDRPSVQRFTEGHELFELLFAVLSPTAPATPSLQARKEVLCDMGSAYLLMDKSSYTERIRQLGSSLGSTQQLAREYQVSFWAALRRLVELAPGRHALVVWGLGATPSEAAAAALERGSGPLERQGRRLRIGWVRRSDGIFVPRGQVIAVNTSIYRAYELGVTTNGEEPLGLDGLTGDCRCENKPISAGSQRKVLSLIHLPGDYDCQPALKKK